MTTVNSYAYAGRLIAEYLDAHRGKIVPRPPLEFDPGPWRSIYGTCLICGKDHGPENNLPCPEMKIT